MNSALVIVFAAVVAVASAGLVGGPAVYAAPAPLAYAAGPVAYAGAPVAYAGAPVIAHSAPIAYAAGPAIVKTHHAAVYSAPALRTVVGGPVLTHGIHGGAVLL